ncbi:MAG: GHKL domain-containing protein [Lachnospiraceae bacterium]|nr:GHKL domain-containing protein [Lachnospiraceae bacterium]MBR1815612.1 GHKL domain-containing protein [Lachnospiraceae bacterium]
MLQIIYDLVYCLIEGTAYTLSAWLLITGFFGYPLKKVSNRKNMLITVISIYVILSTALLTVTDKMPFETTINGVLVLFLLIYFITQLLCKKIKAFFITVTAFEVITILLGILYTLDTMIEESIKTPVYMVNITSILLILLLLIVVWILSFLSSRRRKGPMALSLVAAVFLVFLLIDNVIFSVLRIDRYLNTEPLISLRFVYSGDMGGRTYSIIMLAITVIILLISILLIIKESESMYFREKNTVNEYYIEAQKEHYEGLIASNREIRKIRHDLKNHTYCLQELYKSKKYDELGNYIKDMAKLVEQADTSVHAGDEIVDAICSEKKNKAAKKGITLTVDGKLSGVKLSALDTCTILANILDNAIEAVENLNEDKKHIELTFKRNENYMIITEANPTAHEPDIRDNNIITTKKDKSNHGFGLINIKDTVEKYEGECFLSSTQDDKSEYYIFKIEIILPVNQ